MTETQSGLRKSSPERSRRIDIILLAIIFAVGCFLRLPPATFERGGSLHGLAQIHPQPAYTRLGFDEDLYRVYVEGLSKGGLGAYPEIVDEYIEHQKTLTGSILPPVRFLYIFAGYVWRSAFGCDAMTALQQVAAFFSMLTLCFVALFTWRLRGPLWSLGVTALFAVVPTLIETYHLSITKNFILEYAIATGDGPWHRYLVDLLLVSPIVLLLALGTVFRLNREQKPEWFLTIFIAATYLVMCNLKYGMNLRYANMWDFPLRLLAFRQLTLFAAIFRRWQNLALALALLALFATEFYQYIALAVNYPLYELVTAHLLRALKILKLAPDIGP